MLDEYGTYSLLRGLSRASIEAHFSRFRLFAEWCAERGIDLAAPTAADMQSYIQYLHERTSHHTGRPLSVNTIRKHVDFLKVFGTYLIETGRAKENPAAGLTRPKSPKRVPHSYSADQVRVILKELHAMTGSSTRRKMQIAAFIFLILDTGLRISEALHLRPCDIDFHGRMLRVIGKGDRERVIPFGTVTRELLKQVISMCQVGPEDYIWRSPRTGKPFTSAAVRNTLRILRRRLHEQHNISIPVRPHIFRHTFARNWIVGGGDQFSLMRILGHTSTAMTNHYVRLWSDDLRRKHDAVSPAEKMGIGDLITPKDDETWLTTNSSN